MEFIKLNELFENIEFQQFINNLPKLENYYFNNLKEKNDLRLLNLLNYNEIEKQKFSLIHLIIEIILNDSFEKWKYIFKDYDTDMVKRITSSENNNQSSSSSSLTYGEIDFFSFANILERSQPRQGEIFVDLGHGTGKGLICASLLYGNVLQKCYGIEIVHSLYEISATVVNNYLTLQRNESDSFSILNNNCELTVEEGDILNNDNWTQADIVFANSTCFDATLMDAMARLAERMKPGSRFITLTKQLPSSSFQLLDRRQYVMSWGEATSFIHIKL